MSLQIIQAKPNPDGKENGDDLDALTAKHPDVYLGEWVDVKNIGEDEVKFQTVQLRHAQFDEDCHTTGELELYWIGDNENLFKPGQILRVHGGRRQDAHLMSADDHAGADWHGYVESAAFILNNICGDKIVLSWQDASDQIHQDWVCYAPNPCRNLILKRSGNLLTGAVAESDGQ